MEIGEDSQGLEPQIQYQCLTPGETFHCHIILEIHIKVTNMWDRNQYHQNSGKLNVNVATSKTNI